MISTETVAIVEQETQQQTEQEYAVGGRAVQGTCAICARARPVRNEPRLAVKKAERVLVCKSCLTELERAI